ncbi:helix-turn-helix domain-containing protein [Bacillus badius]|uniref:helix-turn-helix domain-containing protein n=1 Tax=Bacillus badius TaxID=1455 RepID=UPI000597A8D1|nr:helix-turn-helix transcriptional regulator [Bacillus badius]MED4718269.1 helix-turn-helix transcriptional regulator [Bacillus badius]
MIIRNRLGLLLQQHKLSLKALAEKADVNYGTLYNFYHERFQVFNGDLIGKLCVALRCNIEDLIYLEEEKKDAGA